LALLFGNVSVGGTLTHFAAPSVLMMAHKWSLDLGIIFFEFGTRAGLGFALNTVLYFLIFRKEFNKMSDEHLANENGVEIPAYVTIIHIVFMIWTVATLYTPAMVVAGYLFLIGFNKATKHHQIELGIKTPLLVGFCLAGLVTHGGFQTCGYLRCCHPWGKLLCFLEQRF